MNSALYITKSRISFGDAVGFFACNVILHYENFLSSHLLSEVDSLPLISSEIKIKTRDPPLPPTGLNSPLRGTDDSQMPVRYPGEGMLKLRIDRRIRGFFL